MIVVNGVPITEDEIAREVQYHPAGSLDAAQREASIALVVRALLLQEAAALGLSAATPGAEEAGGATAGKAPGAAAGQAGAATAEERAIEAVLDSAISLPPVDEESCRRYFEANRERFRSPDIFEASHILFAASASDPSEREGASRAAESTIQELRRDPGAFERLARERSADTESREQGGHLGQITRGQTTPELESCLERLSPGDLSAEPVGTRYGYHVVRLDRAERGKPLTWEMARERVAEYLGASAWTRAVHQYIQILVGKASIQGIELGGATTPLVQ